MQHFNLFTPSTRQSLIKRRKSETKFGQSIHFIPDLTSIYEHITDLDVDYVIFGISEAIGVYANHGNTGTEGTWDATIKFLLNTQDNKFTKANRVLVLGHLAYPKFEKAIDFSKKRTKKQLDIARQYVERIDKDVSNLVYAIVKAGKIPIIIGGGHNNAYGNIKGSALALNSSLNVINFDAHSDFRKEEGRHSGNGFTYAMSEGFLNNYFIFGLHQNYTSERVLDVLKRSKQIKYVTYEKIIRKEHSFKSAVEKAKQHASNAPFGLELDCDAIENMPSSAETPSGFSVKQARRFIYDFASNEQVKYFHICEAIPSDKKIGKLISYFITDFIYAHSNAHNDNSL